MTDEEYEIPYEAGGSLAGELMDKLKAEARVRFAEMDPDKREAYEDGFWDTIYDVI